MSELETLDVIRQSLEQINRDIDEYRRRGGCGYGCGTHAVGKRTYHLGDNLKVALISEAPGPRTMWLTGVPFHGKDDGDPTGSLRLSQAGYNLNKCLEPLGICFQDVFFTDAVKCRPDEAKEWRPHEQMRTRCLRWLHQQLQVVQPRVIFSLGLTAAHSCLDIAGKGSSTKLKLRDLVGKRIDCTMSWGSCLLVTLWHPSPANPRQRQNTILLKALQDTLSSILSG